MGIQTAFDPTITSVLTSACKTYSTAELYDLIGHFVLASQGLLGHCTFVIEIMPKQNEI